MPGYYSMYCITVFHVISYHSISNHPLWTSIRVLIESPRFVLFYPLISQRCEPLRVRVLSRHSLPWSPSYSWLCINAHNFLFLFNTCKPCLTSPTVGNLFRRTSISFFVLLKGPSHILLDIFIQAKLLNTSALQFPPLNKAGVNTSLIRWSWGLHWVQITD